MSDVALIMYTSGTTGRPKGAMLTHGNIIWNNINALLADDATSQEITLVVAPLFHIGGLNVTPLLCFLKGATVVMEQMFEPGMVLENIEKYHVTSMFGVPAMYLFMAQHPDFATRDLSSIRVLSCGGAPVPEALIKVYAARGLPFNQGYGLTETAPFASFLPSSMATEKLGSAGIAPFFTDVKIVDDDGHDVPDGERGEIVVRGPNVMKGYWNRPDATAEVLIDGWFHTGDVGIRDADGYFFIVDRKKDMIISGGENVYPAEVEDALYQHPGIKEVAVIGVQHPRWGETVRAVVVRKDGVSLTEQEVIEFSQDKLARYKQPKSVVFIDVLPRNPAGKVLKFDLREKHGQPITEAEHPPRTREPQPPRDDARDLRDVDDQASARQVVGVERRVLAQRDLEDQATRVAHHRQRHHRHDHLPRRHRRDVRGAVDAGELDVQRRRPVVADHRGRASRDRVGNAMSKTRRKSLGCSP